MEGLGSPIKVLTVRLCMMTDLHGSKARLLMPNTNFLCARGRKGLFRIVEQLTDTLDSGGYHKYPYIIAVRICRDDKITLSFWIVT